MYVADHTGIPKYKFYNNVVNNSSFIESYSALNNFDKTVTVAFPATKTSDIYYFVHSYEPGQSLNYSSYLTNVNFSNSYFARPNELRSSITLGFLDMLPINRIVLDIRTSTYKYVYARSGTAPEQITLPLNAEFELRDKSVTNFQYQSSQDFIYRISYWYDTTSTAILSWFVRAPQAGVQKISELPAEFATRYPEFNSSNLSHVETAFITQGNTYNDLIDEKFKGKSKPVAYESYSVTPK